MLRPISGTSSPHESDEPSSSVERKVRETWNQQERAMKSESVGRDITDRRRIEELGRKYEFIANASREFMTLIDRNYVYEAANDAYCRAHGKPRREIVGKTVADLWGKADFENSIRPRLDHCFAGREVRYEAQFQFLGGEKRWYDVGCYPYLDDSGKVTHAAVVTRDIHERKKSEQAVRRSEQKLKESENRLDSILKQSPTSFTDWTMKEESLSSVMPWRTTALQRRSWSERRSWTWFIPRTGIRRFTASTRGAPEKDGPNPSRSG